MDLFGYNLDLGGIEKKVTDIGEKALDDIRQEQLRRGGGPLTADEVRATADTSNPLGSGKYLIKNLIFPLELGTPPLHHYMVFFINETKSTQYTSPIEEASRGLPPIDPKNVSSVLSSVDLHSKLAMEQNSVEGTNVMYRPTKRSPVAIGLPMPKDIQTNHKQNWGEKGLGIVGDMVQDLIQTPGGVGEVVKHSINDAMQSIIHSVTSAGIGNVLETKFDLYSPASLVFRGAVNPHQEILYNGPHFREFSFNWLFVPKSEEETNRIKDIIKVFSFYQAPEIHKGIGGRYFVYPAEFDMMFYSGDDQNRYIKKVSTCALTDLNVSYSPGQTSFGYSSLRNGAPTQVQLNLRFVELEMITKARVLEGY